MSRLRVMQVIGQMDVGGIEKLAAAIAKQCRRDKFHVSVCALGGDGPLRVELEEEGVPSFCLGKRLGLDWRIVLRLSRLLRREKVSVLHTHHISTLIYGLPAAVLSGVKGVIHTEHSHDALDDSPRLRFLLRLLARRTEVVVCVADEVASYLTQNVGVPRRKILVLRNGVDTELFRPGLADEALLGELVIGTVGRLDPLKDHLTLLRAFRLLAEQVPNARLVIVGDGPLRRELEAASYSLGIGSKVAFLGRRSDIAGLLRGMHIFVLSSIKEGLPLALLEAMASGVPVVATNVGGIPQVVQDRRTGILCPPGDPARLAQSIHQLIRDDGLRQRLTDAARSLVETSYSLKSTVSGYESLYTAAANGTDTSFSDPAAHFSAE